MAHPYTQETPELPPIPLEWDYIPALGEFAPWQATFPIVPGYDYCWSLLANQVKARADDWKLIGNLGPFKHQVGIRCGTICLLERWDIRGQLFLVPRCADHQ